MTRAKLMRAESGTSTPLTILLADDHDVVLKGTRALLERERGWRVCAEATNGRMAVEKAVELRPNICVLDLSMPLLNGLEATRQIRRRAPETEVVVFSMHDSESLLREVLDAGARGYVLKADAGRSLVSAVQAASEGRPFFSGKISEAVLDGYLRSRGGKPKSNALTPREREILQLLVEGCSNLNVSAILGISIKTVETHRASIMRKLRVSSIAELVRYAIRNHIIEP